MKRFFKIISILTAVLLVTASYAACSSTGDEAENGTETAVDTPSLQLSVDEWPVIDGATALSPYYEAMAAELLGMDIEEARQYVYCNKTDGAFENLINGRADMIFCSLPGEGQLEAAKEAGVTFETYPFLNGGFVFFVNKSNPVDSLTIDQLHDIYAGKITSWKEVGGDDVDIIPYQRTEGSGSQNGMYKYIIGPDEIMEAPTQLIAAEMGDIVDAVAFYDNSEGAIGYSYYYYVANMHYSDDIKLIKIDGIEPNDETIADGTYPIINQSFVIIRDDTPKDSVVRQIIDWVLSEEGQALGEKNGYIRNKSGK